MEQQQPRYNNDEELRAMQGESGSSGLVRNEYTIEERDTIPDIENKHGISWNEILEANRDILGEDASLRPGLKLKIPPRPSR